MPLRVKLGHSSLSSKLPNTTNLAGRTEHNVIIAITAAVLLTALTVLFGYRSHISKDRNKYLKMLAAAVTPPAE